jgi:hypothetical protein
VEAATKRGRLMKKLLLIGALALTSLSVMGGVAAASPGDFAAGGGSEGFGHFDFSAHQAGTLQATGHMNYRSPDLVVTADVVCLNVAGNLAFILGVVDQSKSSGVPAGAERVAFEVKDGPEGDTFGIFFASPALGCGLPPLSGVSVVNGNIVVHDN